MQGVSGRSVSFCVAGENMNKMARSLCIALSACGGLLWTASADAALEWHTTNSYGLCDPLIGCISPSKFDPSLGTLRSIDVVTDTGFYSTYRYFNFGDADAEVTFKLTGEWVNWDSSGTHSDFVSVFMPAGSVDSFGLSLFASESHTAYDVSDYIGLGDFDFYAPGLNYQIDVVTVENGDSAWWEEEPIFHFDGIYSDVSLTYHYTTGSVPEPASWLMMIAGFGATGGVLRRTRRTKAQRATLLG